MAFMQYINRIQFDHGARRELPAELALLGVTRPLLISDEGLAASGLLDIAVEALVGGASLPRFTAVPSNPTQDAVEQALLLYQAEGCDGIIAVGGGSPMDCAKAVGLLLSHGGQLADYLARSGGGARITRELPPIVAMPTTAGTGSEVGRGASITLHNGDKEVFLSPRLIPSVAICDPELTEGLPARLTAATGIDAFTHAFEAFLSPAVNPPADAIALDALTRIWAFLPRAVQDGHDKDARWNVLMGAVEATMTSWKGFGLTHALSMAFDDSGIHHGTVVGTLLPHTIPFLRETVPTERLERLASCLNTDSDGLAAALSDFNRKIGLPSGLAELGVERAGLEAAAQFAVTTAFNQTAPGSATESDYLKIAEAAFGAKNDS